MAIIKTIKKKYEKRKGYRITTIVSCDVCQKESKEMLLTARERKIKGKLARGEDVCPSCMKIRNGKHIAAIGTESLKAISPEQRKINASKAGKACWSSPNAPKDTLFSREKWRGLSSEEKNKKIKKLADNFRPHRERLATDEEYASLHYQKIFRSSRLGYFSKGHKELHKFIKDLGFRTHVHIGSMEIDEVNEELKIAIEYNGDYWHCNPRTWKKDDYNKAIKMTAEEKWQSDIARYKVLESKGFSIIVVWESKWQLNKEHYLRRIHNEVDKKSENKETNVL